MEKISVVIPVYNESESLHKLHESLHKALGTVNMPWEIVYVDDGSVDGSVQVLASLAEEDKEHTRVIALRRNFGQTAAIAAGIDNTHGDIIVLMDADMQNDPADIPMMIEKMGEDYDVVSGWRVRRKDTFITRTLPSRIANWLISWVTGVKLRDYGCTLKAYRREVITGFRLYGEMHRFIPAYAGYVGARIVEVPVQHHPREHGKTKYGLERIGKVILDLLTVKFLISYGHKPNYIFGGPGMLMMGLGSLLLAFLIVRRLITLVSVFESPFFPVSLMLMYMGFQSILMGLLAELQVRTYHEAQQKPTYTVRRVINPSSQDE
ncbi:MAG: glycosyltransferase family 2 protein [Anaerolineales bacterium]|nr:glycosyltransferase family 2 protein [Chloroflexota bacterium]MBL6980224.1 glycosyltransferase family 2 protein [Anaerolineales bacterium]